MISFAETVLSTKPNKLEEENVIPYTYEETVMCIYEYGECYRNLNRELSLFSEADGGDNPGKIQRAMTWLRKMWERFVNWLKRVFGFANKDVVVTDEATIESAKKVQEKAKAHFKKMCDETKSNLTDKSTEDEFTNFCSISKLYGVTMVNPFEFNTEEAREVRMLIWYNSITRILAFIKNKIKMDGIQFKSIDVMKQMLSGNPMYTTEAKVHVSFNARHKLDEIVKTITNMTVSNEDDDKIINRYYEFSAVKPSKIDDTNPFIFKTTISDYNDDNPHEFITIKIEMDHIYESLLNGKTCDLRFKVPTTFNTTNINVDMTKIPANKIELITKFSIAMAHALETLNNSIVLSYYQSVTSNLSAFGVLLFRDDQLSKYNVSHKSQSNI